MSAIQNSTTRTQYETLIERSLDLEGNFPVVRRKYIPSEGSKFQTGRKRTFDGLCFP